MLVVDDITYALACRQRGQVLMTMAFMVK